MYEQSSDTLGPDAVIKVDADDIVERRRRYWIRWTAIKAERSRHLSVWQELADYIMPERGRFLAADHNKPKDTSKILNNTPTRMARSLSAGLLSGHVSPARPWQNITVTDPELAAWYPMRVALYNLNERFRMVLNLSNFYRALAMGVFPDLAVFGLGTMLAEEDARRVLRFIPLAIGTYGLAQDGDGEVDTLQYEEPWTAAELVKEFGLANVSPAIRTNYKNGFYETYTAILRTISRNEEHLPGSIGRRGAQWGSSWMEVGGTPGAVSALAQPVFDPALGFLRDSKYDEFPVLCARWATTQRDTYPVGPGHDARADARMLMQLEKRKLLAISKGVNPTMRIPDALRLDRLSMLPGDAVYVPSGMGKEEIGPVYTPDHQWVAEARLESQAAAARIGQAFFAELMLMFVQETSNPDRGKQPITAQEVAAKQQEKMLQLGPVLENINEFLTHLTHRVLAVMGRRGMIPPFPKEARHAQFRVEFISTLAQAQKLVGTTAKERLVQFVGQVAQIKGPMVLDLVNQDRLVRRYADDLGTPPDALESEEEVQKVRAERERQIQIQQQAQSMLSAAEAAKNLGGVKMDEDNLVTRMVGPVAGAQAGEGGP